MIRSEYIKLTGATAGITEMVFQSDGGFRTRYELKKMQSQCCLPMQYDHRSIP
ncbi:MAG: hypothetical protein ABIR19_10725 [Ginsengibacter sp.]